MPLPLYMLAVGVFAMGTSEFMLAGLVPDIASDLNVSVESAGLLTSAFAAGMVVGAPLMAAIGRRWPARSSLLSFLLAFAIAHVVGALTTSFPVLLASRTVAALANAGFLAVALSAATSLVPAGQRGRALAVLLAGTTVATIAGVPGGAMLGTLFGWRSTFWAIAPLCFPAVLGIIKALPGASGEIAQNGPPHPSVRTEIAQLAQPRLALVIVLSSLVNAATFATFTYLAPIVTDTAELGQLWVSGVLMLFGVGSFIGVNVAGRLSDRHPSLVIAVVGPMLLLGWMALAALASQPVALLLLVFLQGALSFALGSTLITRVLYEAKDAPTMSGSYATAALNIGAAGGPAIAAATLSSGAGDLGPVWLSAFLIGAALLVALPLLRWIMPT